jgi:predicted MFS family arabinose efflux permease
VGQQRLVNALSLDVISNNLGKMAGPIVAGILLDVSGFTGAYSFLLVVHLANLALMTRLRIPGYQGPAQVEPIVRSMKGAISYAWRSPVLVGLFYITIIMNTLAFPFQQFIPAIGRDHLEVGVILVGLLVAADGFGQLAGAGIMALTRDLRFHGRVFVLGCMGVLTLGMIFVWSPWYALTFGLLTMSGIAQSGFATMQSAITMLSTPHDMRGRMMGLLSVFIGVGTPLGAAEIGLVASTISIQWAISMNMFAGLVLLIPAIILSPLAWKPLTQAESETDPNDTAAETATLKPGAPEAGDN